MFSVLYNDSIPQMTSLVFISRRKRNSQKQNKTKIPRTSLTFSIVPSLTGQNMDKSKTPFPLFPLAQVRSSIIFKRSFTSKHRKYQKQKKKKAKLKNIDFCFWSYKSLLAYWDSWLWSNTPIKQFPRLIFPLFLLWPLPLSPIFAPTQKGVPLTQNFKGKMNGR